MLAYYLVPRERLTSGRILLLMAAAVLVLQFQHLALEAIDGVRGDSASGLVGESAYALEAVNPLRVAAALAPLLIYGLLVDKSRLGSHDFFYANTLFVNAATWLAVAGSAYLARFAIYTSMFLLIAIPQLLLSLRKETRILVTAALLALYGLMWYLDTSKDATVYNFNWIFERA
jgi:hypothetical protein